MKTYYPYKANDNKHKYYIITSSGKKIYFGAYGMSDFTINKDPERKERYIEGHKKNELKYLNKSGIDTASFWSYKYLWSYPTKEEAYSHIKNDLRRWGVLN